MALRGIESEFLEDAPPDNRVLIHNKALRENIEAVAAIKCAFRFDDLPQAFQVWSGLPEEVRDALWLSTTAGGVFSTEERKIMQSSEFKTTQAQSTNQEGE